MSKGTVDTLMEVGWVKIRGRKRTPGRPVTYGTYGTTEAFLVQFGLESVSHLPGTDELKAAGFLEAIPPPASRCPIFRRPDRGRRPLYRGRTGRSSDRQRPFGRSLGRRPRNQGASASWTILSMPASKRVLRFAMSAALSSGVIAEAS